MSSQFETKKFKELNAKWAKKLEKSGFEDIEQPDGRLQTWHSEWFKYRANPTLDLAKQDYYRHAGYFLYEHKFKSELEKEIWEFHAEGISIREISKLLNKKYPRSIKAFGKINKSKVNEVLKPLVAALIKKIQVK